MKAIVIDTFGGPEVFKEQEVPNPDLLPGHVLIRVAATSVNPLDYKIRAGVFQAFTPPFPATLHGDVAGVVVAVGEGVTQYRIGDEVYGCAGGVAATQGALAEFMVADAHLLSHKPKALTMEEAASLPLVIITAWEALIDRIKVQKGQTVLIHGGTGGVGHVAIQLAKWCGAKVFTTVSSEEKGAIAKDLGADEVIYYKEEAVVDYVQRCTGGAGFDVVFDTIGGGNIDASLQAMANFGHVASILADSTHDLTPLFLKNGTFHAVIMLYPLLSGKGRAAHGEIMKKTAALVDQGILRPLIDKQQFTFAKTGKAHERLESGNAIGKVVLSTHW